MAYLCRPPIMPLVAIIFRTEETGHHRTSTKRSDHHCLCLSSHLTGKKSGRRLACFHNIRHLPNDHVFLHLIVDAHRNCSISLCLCAWLKAVVARFGALLLHSNDHVYVLNLYETHLENSKPLNGGLRLWEHILVSSNGLTAGFSGGFSAHRCCVQTDVYSAPFIIVPF